MKPETARAWQRIFRDIAIVIVASFILIHETVSDDSPNEYLIGAALVMFGIIPAIRWDASRRQDTPEDD